MKERSKESRWRGIATRAIRGLFAGITGAASLRGWWSLRARVYHGVLAVALLAFVPFFVYWNLI